MTEIRLEIRDTGYVSELNSKDFIRQRNQLLVMFICAALNIEFEEQTTQSFLFFYGYNNRDGILFKKS